MKTYIAGKWQDRERIEKNVRPYLEAMGFEIISSWHSSKVNPEETPEERAARIVNDARRDWHEIEGCDCFILLPLLDKEKTAKDTFYPPGSVAGVESSARYTELGMAMASGDREIIIVGDHQNIFVHLCPNRVDSWTGIRQAKEYTRDRSTVD